MQIASVQGGATDESEERQGKALIDVAISQGVRHFVYSSVDRGGEKSEDNPTDVPHFRTKHNIEKHLLEKVASGQMSYTIIRPVAFMEGYEPGFMGKIFGTIIKVGLRPEKPLQWVSVADIGWFAAQALVNPEDPTYKNQAINLAGDELTFDQANEVFLEKTGYPLPTTFEFIGRFMKWMLTEVNIMFRWFDEEGYGADIAALKKIHPSLQSLGDYIDNNNGIVKK